MAERAARTRVWRHGKIEAEGFPLEDVSDYVAREDCIVWADVVGTDHETLYAIAGELGIDPHAVEDVVSKYERPKLDRYDTFLFLNCYTVHLDRESGELQACKVSAFVTKNALITIRHSKLFDTDDLSARWDAAPELLQYGVTGLLHGLLDEVVDTHIDVVQQLDDEIEALEDLLFAERPQQRQVQHRTYTLRRSLVQTRRFVLPMRELLDGLLRRDYHLLDPALVPYYRDVYDHVLRATEWTESLRDMVTTVFETNLSLQGARQNNIMKQLTGWAAIIAVPTAITGFYGQNVPYPGYGQHWGFWVSSVVTVVIAVGLYASFKKRDWL